MSQQSRQPKELQVKDNRAAVLARLEAQKILALEAGNTKAAAMIQRVIERISKK